MALLKAVQKAFKQIAPLSLAEPWDNVGLLFEAPYPRQTASRVLLTIDLTPAVVDSIVSDSVSKQPKVPNVGVVVSYHPPIFRGLKTVTLQDPLQASLLRLAANGISVYSPHTSLDVAVGGINEWLAEGLGKGTHKAIEEKVGVECHEGGGIGRVMTLEREVDLEEMVHRVKKHLNMETVMLARSSKQSVKTIAMCAGSGGSVLKGVQADLWLTGELSHHETLAAVASGTNVILCNHSNTERPYLSQVLQPRLQHSIKQEMGEGYDVVVSELDRDPLEFV